MSTIIAIVISIIISSIISILIQEARWKLKKKFNKLWDDPEYDATDFAHPAFFRGEAWSCDMFCKLMNEVLDGKKPEGRMYEPLESVRWKAFRAIADRNHSLRMIKKCFIILNEYKPDITGGMHLADQVRKLCIKLQENKDGDS